MRWVCFSLLFSALVAGVGAQTIPELTHPFSAVAVITIAGQPPMQAHIYMDKERQRIDFDSSTPGMAGAYQLILIAEKKVYLVLPETHKCLASDLSRLPGPARQAVGAELHQAKPSQSRALPDAVIDGQRCRGREWTVNRDGQAVTIRMWTTQDARQVPLRTQILAPGEPAMTVHYIQVQAGPPAASLFAPPAGCH